MGCLLLKFGVDSLSAPKNNGPSKLSGLPFSDHCKTPYTEKAEGSNDIQKPDKWFNMTKKRRSTGASASFPDFDLCTRNALKRHALSYYRWASAFSAVKHVMFQLPFLIMNLSRIESILIVAFLNRVPKRYDVERHNVIRQVEQLSNARCSVRIRIEGCPYARPGPGNEPPAGCSWMHWRSPESSAPVPLPILCCRRPQWPPARRGAVGKGMKLGNLCQCFLVPDDDELPGLVVFCRRSRHGSLKEKFDCRVGNRVIRGLGANTASLVKIAVRVSMSDVAGIPVFTAAVFDAGGVDGSVAANTRDDRKRKICEDKTKHSHGNSQDIFLIVVHNDPPCFLIFIVKLPFRKRSV